MLLLQKKVINDAAKEGMKEVLADIQSGKFAKEWIEENVEFSLEDDYKI